MSAAAATEPAVFVPWNDGNDVMLFAAGRDELDILRNYTASWKQGRGQVSGSGLETPAKSTRP